MAMRVVNVRRLRTPEQRAGVVYVGRSFAGWAGHALGNPFRRATMHPHHLTDCLNRYRDWLEKRPTLENDLAALWEQTGRGTKPLGCWCVDAEVGDGQACVCHAQVLAAMLQKRFGAEGAA